MGSISSRRNKYAGPENQTRETGDIHNNKLMLTSSSSTLLAISTSPKYVQAVLRERSHNTHDPERQLGEAQRNGTPNPSR